MLERGVLVRSLGFWILKSVSSYVNKLKGIVDKLKSDNNLVSSNQYLYLIY